MFKTFKEWLLAKGVGEDAYTAKTQAEMAALQKEYMQYVSEEMKKSIDNGVTKTEVEEIKKGLLTEEAAKGFVKAEDFANFKTLLDEATEKANRAIEGMNPLRKNVSFRESIVKSLEANKEAIENLKNDPNGKITVKTVAPMTFATHTTGNVGRVERESGITNTLNRVPNLLQIVNVGTTSASVYEWTEKTGREGGVAMVAEGTVKPQGDWDLVLRSIKPKKAAIIVTVSKEMLADIDGMAADIEAEIYEQLRLFTDTIILDGDGLGNNIVGFDANATAFVAGSFADMVVNPNMADVIRVAINQVLLNNDYPTHVVMHPSDATLMELEKDPTTSQYILPPFSTLDGTKIKGIPVHTSVLVTQGEAYVGNFSRFNVKMREEIEFVMGYRGAQGDWEKNMVSFLGEERLFGFIKTNHFGSIVKVDFETAIAALEKPAPVEEE